MTTSKVRRMTVGQLPGYFGPDSGRRIIITIVPGQGTVPDMLVLRPFRTRRPESVSVIDVYRYALQCRANLEFLEKAREKKARKAARLASQRQERAERKLFGKE
jgi:hypothetical protein